MKPRSRARRALHAILWIAALGTGSCGRSSDSDRLVLTGSSTVAPLASEIGRAFEARHPGVRVDVQTGGSSRGVADARDGSADIGMVSRALHDNESDLLAHTIGWDGIAVIVHADNPVMELNKAQVLAVYTGRVNSWNEVGGAEAPITVINKAEGRSTLELFLKYLGVPNSSVDADIVIGDNEQGIKTVAGNPHAIAYVSVGTAEYDVSAGVPIKILPLEGITATSSTVASGDFPLSRPLNFVTKGEPGALATELIRFAQSEDVDEIVRQQFFVPLTH